MKKILSTSYNDTAFNFALLLLRGGLGVLVLPHGYQKLIHFAERKNAFFNFFGMGSTLSLSIAIFIELICSFLLILGLFTRISALLLVMLTSFIVFNVNKGDIFGKAEYLVPLLLGFLTVLLIGGGKYSVEGIMGK